MNISKAPHSGMVHVFLNGLEDFRVSVSYAPDDPPDNQHTEWLSLMIDGHSAPSTLVLNMAPEQWARLVKTIQEQPTKHS